MATIEIDGKTIEAENGKMIIEVADETGIYIPRFCYHKKLSVAANCRMCLVEVENGRKPVPACATPITDGMKVFTKSEEAIRSQQAVMEFLLINHPLDCPICDQGGECELQDISMGFGDDLSQYEDSKRSVDGDDLGPLISTEMTRCIHCTRCVRFGDEVAGLRELGATGRGEETEIGTYVRHSMKSEVSGNIIDLCPVGALTSKPYRYTARAWEMTQQPSIAPHDCIGSNTFLHTRRERLMRVVPHENENINETWLSDRDRFSYTGCHSEHRAGKPKIKRNGQWETVEWPEALKFVAENLANIIKEHGPEQVAAFASPSSTVEEMYLLQKLCRELGVNNLDHRLQQTDFRDQDLQPISPTSSLEYSSIEKQENIFLIGCNIHREVPLAGLRVRKAFRNGAAIYAMNSVDYDYHFTLNGKILVSPQEMPIQLARILSAMIEDKSKLPESLQTLLVGLEINSESKAIAEALKRGNSAIITGALLENHPEASLLRTLVHHISKYSKAGVLSLTTGSNSAGAWMTGVLPHRSALGKKIENPGLDIQEAINARLKAYVLLGIEPAYDIANPANARQAMLASEFVVMLSAFEDESMLDYCDVILPIATYAETSGTFVNVNQYWQSFKGAIKPFEEARPAWKVLRVLANLLDCPGFDYTSSKDILDEVLTQKKLSVELHASYYYPESLPEMYHSLVRVGEWPIYRIDQLVRHAQELQECAAADSACIKLNPKTADRLKLDDTATISQGNIEITLPLKRDERVVPDVVWVANALPETADLGHSFAEITIKR